MLNNLYRDYNAFPHATIGETKSRDDRCIIA